jgi:hypothetical protein
VIRRLPWELLALAVLAVTRALPVDGGWLGLRLAAATICLLVPGMLIARALGHPSASAALAWSLAALFAASAVMFAVGGSLWLALGLYGGIGLAAAPFAFFRPLRPPSPWLWLVLVLGLAFGIALWWVAPALDGDALFHMGRIRKLDAFGSLHLRTVDEFRDGGLHPGYAFPLWHVLLALVGRLADVDPSLVLTHEATVLAPLAFLVAYEAGAAVFRSAWGGLTALFPQVALIALAPGRGGAYTALALPATAARQLLVTAVIALFFLFVHAPSWRLAAAVAAGEFALAVVHPTYAIFVAIPLAGYAVARVLLARREVVRGAIGLAAIAVPLGALGLWLLPLVRETASHNPSAAEQARGLEHYAGQVDVFSLHRFRLAPEVFGRTGAVAVAALLLVPLAALAARRRWAALVLGGSLAVLAIELIPFLFTRFSDAVSLSQARRAAGFVPFAIAFAGGAFVAARFLRVFVLPAALAAGIVLQHFYRGDFTYGGAGGPAYAAWIALFGAAAAVVLAAVSPWRLELERAGMIAAAASLLFVIPVAVDGLSPWSVKATETKELTPGLIRALRTDVPKGAIVFSDDTTSYRIAAWAPVYVANALPGHVADTKANRPYERREDSRSFFRTGDLAIPRRYHAQFLVVNTARNKLRFELPRLYSDERYTLYRL